MRQASWQASRRCACARLSAISDGSIDSICKSDRVGDLHQLIERPLVGDGQQGVLMAGVELLRVAGQRFGPGPERQVAQAAFFELGELAADVVGRAGDDARHAELAAQRDADPGAGQPLVADERAKCLGQLLDAVLGVQRSGFLAPANRARDDSVAALVGAAVAHDQCQVQHRAADFEDRAAAFGLPAPVAAHGAAPVCWRRSLLFVGLT